MVQALPPSPLSPASTATAQGGDARAPAPGGAPLETFRAAMTAALQGNDGPGDPSTAATNPPVDDETPAPTLDLGPLATELAGLQAALLLQVAPTRPTPPSNSAGAATGTADPVSAINGAGQPTQPSAPLLPQAPSPGFAVAVTTATTLLSGPPPVGAEPTGGPVTGSTTGSDAAPATARLLPTGPDPIAMTRPASDAALVTASSAPDSTAASQTTPSTDATPAAQPALAQLGALHLALEVASASLGPAAPQSTPTDVGASSAATSVAVPPGSPAVIAPPTASPLDTRTGSDSDQPNDGGDGSAGSQVGSGGAVGATARPAESSDTASVAPLGPQVERPVRSPNTPTEQPVAAASSLSLPALGVEQVAGPRGAAPGSPADRSALVDQLLPSLDLARQQPGRLVHLTLQPEGLGAVSLRVALDNGSLSVHLGAERAATRDLLQGALPQLSAALDQRGVPLSQLLVELSGSQAGPSSWGQPSARRSAPSPRSPVNRVASAIEATSGPTDTASTSGLVDYHV